MDKMTLGIYIHIPFCKDKCYYCDFISFKNMENKADDYINCLEKEIESQNWDEINDKYQVTTIYIGGGTPSYINCEHIEKVLNKIREYTNIENTEITIEVNPGTVTKEKLEIYKRSGVNRLSIGLQSTKDNLLKEIGRIHDYKQFLETYNLAKDLGFKNINIDLMLGLPNQTIEDLKNSVEEYKDKYTKEENKKYDNIFNEANKEKNENEEDMEQKLIIKNNEQIIEERKNMIEQAKRTSSQVVDTSKVIKNVVNQQGENINDIENNIIEAVDNFKKGGEEIKKFKKKSEEKIDKKKLCFVFTGCVLLVLVILYLIKKTF